MKSAARLSLLVAIILTMAVWASAQVDPKDYLSQRTVDYSVARPLPYLTPGQMMFENVKVDDLRFAILMKWKKTKFEPIQLRQLATTQIAVVDPGTITIDGDPSDWDSIPPVVVDPAGDLEEGYPITTGTDFTNVYLAHDGEFLYFRMTLANGGPIAETQYTVELQQYLYQLHTPGDVGVTAYLLPSGEWDVFIGDRAGCLKAELPGMAAGKDGCVEWKAPLINVLYPQSVPLPYYPAVPANQGIENTFIRVYIHPTPGGVAQGVSDSNDELTRPMIINFYPYE